MLRLPVSSKILFDALNISTSVIEDLNVFLSTTNSLHAILVILLLAATALGPFRSKRKSACGPSESLQVLSSIITPTCTSWPKEYATFLGHSTSAKSKSIRYNLSKFLTGIYMGDIEFRDFRDLPCLLNGPLQTYGWHVYLSVDFSLRSTVFCWIITSQASTSKHGPNYLGEQGKKVTKLAVEDILEMDAIRYQNARLSNLHRTISPSICLDYIPYTELDSAIHMIQQQLQPKHTVSFQFTAIASTIPFLSDRYIFCAYPFMQQSFMPAPQVSCRTSTPLLVSLQRIIELLTSRTSTTRIETVLNVTIDHANALRFLEQELMMNPALRSTAICKWGLKGWREYRWMLSWEAGLLQAGCLERWSITLRK